MPMVGSLKGIVAESVASIRTRLTLFGLEWVQARADLWRQGLQMLIGVVLIFMALILTSFLLVLLAWDTPYRIWAVGLLAIFYAVLGVGLLWLAKRSLTSEGGLPFSATIEAVTRDADQLANWAQTKSANSSLPARDKAESP
jgi:uncharacterized membrane protein YqjE